MKKLPGARDERILFIAAAFLLLSILLMIIILPGIYHDTYAKANPTGALIAVSIAILIRLIIFSGYIKIIRDYRRSNKKSKGALIAIGILLVFFGLIYMDGAFAFLSHEDILYVSVLMFISTFCDLVAGILTIIVIFLKSQNVKKPGLAGIPAWGLSLIALFVSVIPLIIVDDPKSTSLDTIQIIGWIINIFLVTVACFFICKAHPKSVWYTPVICNGVAIIGLIANTSLTIGFTIAGQDYGTTSTEWIIIVCSVLLSVTGAIVGARIGQRKLDKQND